MSTMTTQITSLTIVYLIVCSSLDQRRHQSSASLAVVRGIHRWPVNSPHKGPVTRKMIPYDDVIMFTNSIYLYVIVINLLAPGRFDSNFKSIFLKLVIQNFSLSHCCEIALRWMTPKFTDDFLPFVQVQVQIMAWYLTASSHDSDLCRQMTSLGP